MSKETFIGKVFVFRILSIGCLFSTILFLIPNIGFAPFGELSIYILPILFIFGAFICWKIPPSTIEVDESGIKRLNNATGWMSKLLRLNSECQWNWIESVSTIRSSKVHYYTTILNVSKTVPYKSKYLVSIESNFFKDYISILKIIRTKAPQANFDETTELILKGQIDIRPIRPFFVYFLIIFGLIIFIYLFFCSKS
ncbi:MAG: hypothetical protein JW976_15695 [Syntrophaceae bacterium]|nr:hypothetical protein [Syntrophaceae bacterium]